MMVTVAPLPSVAKTIPPGFSRMKAPPPSEALMMAMMGVGSAVMVDVEVSVGGSVTANVRLGEREGVCVGTPKGAVACSGPGDEVLEGMGAGVNDV